jgi:3-(3-hydroxy-phenyl)propionate hydroxylase
VPDYDVVIVGCGPVGATLANLVGRRSLRVLAVERETSIYHLPRAVCFDGEILRMYQALGIADGIADVSVPLRGARFENERGEHLLSWDLPYDRHGSQGWGETYVFHQPDVEALLRERLAELRSVELLLGHEVHAVTQDTEEVTVSLSQVAGGEERTVTAAWVVGCDGASSLVRKTIGAEFRELGPSQDWLVVDAVRRAGREPDVPDVFVGYCWPSRPHAFLPMGNPRLRWELMVVPDDDRDRITTPAGVLELIQRFVTPEDIQIERAVIYTFRSLLAETWRDRRVLLAGDAAHLQPPFRAQGLCSGIRDVFNLAWKLDEVHRGGAAGSLLDTYETERQAHAEAWITIATELSNVINTTDPEIAARRDAHMIANPPPYDPSTPRLGAGLHQADDPAPAGFLSLQPALPDGTRLDDAIGSRFLVAMTPAVAAELPAATRAILDDRERFHVLDPESPVTAELLSRHGGHAALVIRPDRYVLGAADGATGLGEVLGRWTVHTRGRRAARSM